MNFEIRSGLWLFIFIYFFNRSPTEAFNRSTAAALVLSF